MVTKTRPLPPTATLHELFHYNPDTGQLTWRVSRSGTAKVGAEAGYIVTKRLATAADLAERTGFDRRYFTRLAASGIDWAWQPSGPGGKYVFDLAGFEQWWEARRTDQWRKTSKSAGASGTGASKSKAKKGNSVSVRNISQKLASASA